MDMHFHWLKDRECQQQFKFYWRPGKLNHADYWTKHHSAAHHVLGWQCRQLCLSATPLKRQTFLSVAHVPTRRRHSVMSANFSAVGVVSVRPIADTHSYMYVGISIDEAVTTYEDKKNLHLLRFCIHSQVLTLSKSK